MRLVFLDTGPLGMISNPRGKAPALRCRQWVKDLSAAGVRVLIPEIADYEVRRELLRVGAPAGIGRLDQVKGLLDYVPITSDVMLQAAELFPITSDVMLQAAELWAASRRAGRPNASPDALDGDCILAATAILAAGPGDVVTVATDNVGHLGQFIDARPWESIV